MADKRCLKCGNPFPATPDFFRRDKKAKDGLRAECKGCSKRYFDRIHKNNVENAICAYCQKPFYRAPSQPTVIHCSRTCRANYDAARIQAKGKRTEKDYNRILITYTCQWCGREFRDRQRVRMFCSRSCASQKTQEPRRWPMRLCMHCQQPFRPRKKRPLHCCQECREQSPVGQFAKKLEGHHRTDIEAVVEQCLQALNVRYEFEKQFGKYWVDFFLPDYNLAIECDGAYWHNSERSERDQKRDINLKEKYHIRIQRFTDKQICGNIQDLIIATLAS